MKCNICGNDTNSQCNCGVLVNDGEKKSTEALMQDVEERDATDSDDEYFTAYGGNSSDYESAEEGSDNESNQQHPRSHIREKSQPQKQEDEPKVVINKKQEQPLANIPEVNQTKVVNSNETKKPTNSKRTDVIRVNFHVLVAPEVNIQPADCIAICFDRDDMGGLNNYSHILKLKRTFEKPVSASNEPSQTVTHVTYLEYDGEVKFPKYVLKYNIPPYRYCVVNHSTNIIRVKWEHREYHHPFRWLEYGAEMTDVYDGVISTSQTDVFTSIRTSMQIFLPTIKECLANQNKARIKADAVIKSIYKTYKAQFIIYYKDIAFEARYILFDRLLQVRSKSDAAHESVTEAGERMILAAVTCAVCAGEELDDYQYAILFQAFRIRPNFKHKSCPDYDQLKRVDTKLLDKSMNSLLNFCQQAVAKGKALWIYCMPILHFHFNDVEPFKQWVDKNINHWTDEWWGIKELNSNLCLKDFKSKDTWKRELSGIHDVLKQLFIVDCILQRTLIASFSLKQVESYIEQGYMLDPTICLANTCFFLNDYQTQENAKALEKNIQFAFKGILRLEKESFRNMLYNLIRTATNTMSIRERWNCKSYKCLHFELIKCSLLVNTVSLEVTEREENKAYIQQNVMSCISSICSLLSSKFDPTTTEDISKWNDILEQEWSGSSKQRIESEVSTHFKKALETQKHASMLTDIYCDHSEEYHSIIQSHLSAYILQDIEKYDKFQPKTKRLEKYTKLLSEKMKEKWEDFKKRDKSTVEICLQWPQFEHFLSSKELLEDGCKSTLNEALTILNNQKHVLKTGEITVCQFKTIANHADTFCKYVASTENEREEVLKLVQRNRRQCDNLLHNNRSIRFLVEQFDKVNEEIQTASLPIIVDIQEVQTKLDKLNIEEMQFNDFCSIDHGDERINIRQFDFPADFDAVLNFVFNHINSNVFRTMWRRHSLLSMKSTRETVSFIKAVIIVFELVQSEWENVVQKIVSKDLSIKETEIFFPYIKNGDDLMKELEAMGLEKNEAFVEIFFRFKMLNRSKRVAETVLLLAKQNELIGDFGEMKECAAINIDGDTKFSKFEEFGSETRFDDTTNITDIQCHCIQVFNESTSVLTWIKQMGDSWRQFVDLASIRVGESATDMALIRYFDTAVTAYSPLIFGLTRQFGYKETKQNCRLVWDALEANGGLPDKLKLVQDHEEWYKFIQKNIGSDEVSSMELATEINKNGFYCVGYLKETSQRKANHDIFALSTILNLTIPNDDLTKVRYLNYEFLQNLQSRLMLVSGRDTETNEASNVIDKYIQVFDGAVRLGNVFKKLILTGCILFKDWKVQIQCSDARPVCFLEFGTNFKGLEWRANKDEGVISIVPKLALFMETCLSNWFDYIHMERSSCLALNYFTMDQLVILQRELVKVGKGEISSSTVFPLLGYVRENCKEEDIVEAMKMASKQVKEQAQTNKERTSGPKDDVESYSSKYVIEDNTMVAKLVRAGIELSVAVKAVKEVGDADFLQACEWAEENQESILKEEKEMQIFKGWSAIESTEISLERSEQIVNPTEKDLQRMWNSFINSFESSVANFLSLKHLSLILEFLSKDVQQVNRTIRPSLEQGAPNLVVCQKDNILRSTLAIYMHGDSKTFPKPEEVLLCTKHTSLDEVDIFLRRALVDVCGRIYCLVQPEILTFAVDDTCERKLETLLQSSREKNIQYRFIVLTNGVSNGSRIVSALTKYRRENPKDSFTNEALQEYILQNLSINCVPVDTLANESVQLITSKTAGQGKTLVAKHTAEKFAVSIGKPFEQVYTHIPLQETEVDVTGLVSMLIKTAEEKECHGKIYVIDIYPLVEKGIDNLLFNLCILGCIVDNKGKAWRRSVKDRYLIESLFDENFAAQKDTLREEIHQMLSILPKTYCLSPYECTAGNKIQTTFDQKAFLSKMFQLPLKYLQDLDDESSLFKPFSSDLQPERNNGARNDDTNDTIQEQFREGDNTSRVLQQRDTGAVTIPHISTADFPFVKSPETALQLLLKYCGVTKPSWAELTQFVRFLNTQIEDFENSAFCQGYLAEDLPGFPKFVLKFLIQMSKDFSTRSLNISEETDDLYDTNDEDEFDISKFQLKRTWESRPHPYIFFNPDHVSMTFLGFNIDRRTHAMIDSRTGDVLEPQVVSQKLNRCLEANKVPLRENFTKLSREQKLDRICQVMGNDMVQDPDESYEITEDNAKKILAVYMRMRCNIPVVVMGETGSGKTRLVEFMCQLQLPAGSDANCMITMKIHGGTKPNHIIKKVREAEICAIRNTERFGSKVFTVLFLDEANSTDCIGLIKEILCDKSIQGNRIDMAKNLKIIAACNPYRKHHDEFIKKTEESGLGYHVNATDTTDRFGKIPMRRLVYRVRKLPQSLMPFVWDFGQLDTETEKLYIRQMLCKFARGNGLPTDDDFVYIVTEILSCSQNFMREQKDECSFVSLRDVERTLLVIAWFYKTSQKDKTLFLEMDKKLIDKEFKYKRNRYNDDWQEYETIYEDDSEAEEEDSSIDSMPSNASETIYRRVADFSTGPQDFKLDDLTRSLVLALGACYHAGLRKRADYRKRIAACFETPCYLPGKEDQFECEILACQEVFLDSTKINPNIAKNMALKENVFMMTLAVQLKIPLFLVGKPGSSKSLSKTIVADAMRGKSSENMIYSKLNQAKFVSYQCSPLATAESIVTVFKQCAQSQQDNKLDRYVSVVVLDEVGLAEDSPSMPLKTLHPLLEGGYRNDFIDEPSEDKETIDEIYCKVGFIGISNWALDPAKMNRGIMVQRHVPEFSELKETARGICASDANYQFDDLFEPLATAYRKLLEKVTKLESVTKREFYGLRDFYSLLKMMQAIAVHTNMRPTKSQIQYAIMRNFGGLDTIDPCEIFAKHVDILNGLETDEETGHMYDCTPSGMIQHSLRDVTNTASQCRYLLLMTEHLGMATLLKQKIFKLDSAITIYGSSFPNDLDFTQACRNINKIKACMETGSPVILLNLENIYESLYDALNQYYTYYGNDRFVDIGLGTHRVNCKVHPDFRLIVVAEKNTVYDTYPIPLINRLEKHVIKIETLLTEQQLCISNRLRKWVKDYCSNYDGFDTSLTPSDVFRGFHKDTCATIVLHLWQNELYEDVEEMIFEQGKKKLLCCATPESVLKVRQSCLPEEDKMSVPNDYWTNQAHGSLAECIMHNAKTQVNSYLWQITTHAPLLSTSDKTDLAKALDIKTDLWFEYLMSFDTEQQFILKIRKSIDTCRSADQPSVFIVMCEYSRKSMNLIDCARHCIEDECIAYANGLEKLKVILLVRLNRAESSRNMKDFVGFQCGQWKCVHIDDVRENKALNLHSLTNKSVGEVLRSKHTDHWDASDNQAFLKDVLLNCVPEACAMVKDDSPFGKRLLRRVHHFMEMLKVHLENGDVLKSIVGFVAELMLQIEKKVGNQEELPNWLNNISRDNILKSGTLRAAAKRNIEKRVVPVLAEIIAYIDRNANLDLLDCKKHEWLKAFFLRMMSKEIMSLHIADILRVRSLAGNAEIISVRTSGFESQAFHNRLPFSWLIFERLEHMIQREHTDGHCVEVMRNMEQILMETGLGKTLLSVDHSGDFILEYVYDILSMVTNTTFQSENEALRKIVLNETVKRMKQFNDPSLITKLLVVHNAVRYLRSVMITVRTTGYTMKGFLNGRCEDLFRDWYESVEDSDDIHIEVLKLLKRILKNMVPVDDSDLNKKDKQEEFLKKVYVCRPIVEKLFEHGRHNNTDDKTNNRESFSSTVDFENQLLRTWNSLLIMKLYIEHIRPSETANDTTCRKLWIHLDENFDITKTNALYSIERFLKNCNMSVMKSLFGNIDACTRCKTERKNILSMELLSCQHFICSNCFTEIKSCKEGIANKCGVCKREIDTQYDPIQHEGTENESMKQLKDFQQRCNSFYLAIITELCFAGKETPADDLVHRLMFLVTSHQGTESRTNIIQKQNLTLFVDSIDSTPVFRSSLLRLLLKSCEIKVKHYLGEYMTWADVRLAIRENKDDPYTISVCVLAVQCYEDIIHEISTHTNEVKLATTTLEDAVTSLQLLENTNIGILPEKHESVRRHLKRLGDSIRINFQADRDVCKIVDDGLRLVDLCLYSEKFSSTELDKYTTFTKSILENEKKELYTLHLFVWVINCLMIPSKSLERGTLDTVARCLKGLNILHQIAMVNNSDNSLACSEMMPRISQGIDLFNKMLKLPSGETMVDEVNAYLEKNIEFLSKNTGTSHLWDMFILAIQSFQFLQIVSSTTENYPMMLETVAQLRYGFHVLSKYIHNGHLEPSETFEIDELLKISVEIITDYLHMPGIFLLKNIFRGYGFHAIQQFCQTIDEDVSKIPRELGYSAVIKMDGAEQDVYTIFGDTYVAYREAVMTTRLRSDKGMMEHIECTTLSEKVLLCLAIHREVTLLPSDQLEMKDNKTLGVVSVCLEEMHLLQETHRRLLSNTLARHCRYLDPHDTITDQRVSSLHCYLVHSLCVYEHLQTPEFATITFPLAELTLNPIEFEESYLPAMPIVNETLLTELKDAIDSMSKDAYNNIQWYSCPNGHPYAVGNCGKVVGTGRCIECGENVGAKAYNELIVKNQKGLVKQTGYILGNLDGTTTVIDRLSPVVGCVLRLLTHTAMYLGCNDNIEAVTLLISGQIPEGDVIMFLFNQIVQDIMTIGQALDKSHDDVLIMMHHIIQNMLSLQNTNYTFVSGDRYLKNAETRAKWEADICNVLIQPALKAIDSLVQDAVHHIGKDIKFAQEDNFKKILEIDSAETQYKGNIMEHPAMWQYRIRISVPGMTNKLTFTNEKQFAVLKYFMERLPIMRGLKYIPSIKKLQTILLQKFSRTLDKTEVEGIKIQQLRLDETKEIAYNNLIDDFLSAWKICHKKLAKYGCLVKGKPGFARIPETCRTEIKYKSTIAVLLPAQHGQGLCSFALLQFLLKQQNELIEFVRQYHRIPYIQEISMNTITPPDIVIFDSDDDILQLVHANSQFSFEVRGGGAIEYDFDHIERQIIEKYICAKPTIRFSKDDLAKADEMTYRFEATSWDTLNNLSDIIDQEPLDETVKLHITQECRYLPEICDTLHNVNIAINFLRSLGSRKPDEFLLSFMKNVLKLRIQSFPAYQSCRLKHIRSLWLLLSQRKATISTLREQPLKNIFDGVPDCMFEILDAPTQNKLYDFYGNRTRPSLMTLSEIIFECVVLFIGSDNQRQSISLKENLVYQYEGTRGHQLDTVLEMFPEMVSSFQSADACAIAFRVLDKKINAPATSSRFAKTIQGKRT